MNIKIDILNVPKHGNKHDLIQFVTRLEGQLTFIVCVPTKCQ